jgi:hypothetical protein
MCPPGDRQSSVASRIVVRTGPCAGKLSAPAPAATAGMWRSRTGASALRHIWGRHRRLRRGSPLRPPSTRAVRRRFQRTHARAVASSSESKVGIDAPNMAGGTRRRRPHELTRLCDLGRDGAKNGQQSRSIWSASLTSATSTSTPARHRAGPACARSDRGGARSCGSDRAGSAARRGRGRSWRLESRSRQRRCPCSDRPARGTRRHRRRQRRRPPWGRGGPLTRCLGNQSG